MRSNKSDSRGLDHSGEQLLRELDLLQSRTPVPDIEPPQLIDQAVRNMARRELPDPPTASLAGKLSWIAGLSIVSIALIAVGISMVQSPALPPQVPSPAAELSKTSVADESSDRDEARAESAQARLDLIRQLYDQGLLTEAAEQLRAFSADYPEYPLPEWAAELPH